MLNAEDTREVLEKWFVLRGELASPRGFVRDISAFAARIEVPLEAWQRAA
jgi:hypothetical protein